jgi:hypothetical protein
MHFLPWLIVLGVISIVIAVATVAHLREKGRTARLAEVARELGFDFSPLKNPNLADRLKVFTMFNQGRGRTVWNVLRGGTDSEQLVLFDYKYTVGSGKNSRTYRQTMAMFESQLLTLPHFEMRPERWWDRVRKWMGAKEIEFADHPVFSRQYYVVGHEGVRQVFNERVIRHFEKTDSAFIAGQGGLLVFCHANRRRDAENLRAFLDEAYQVYALLKPAEAPQAEAEEA